MSRVLVMGPMYVETVVKVPSIPLPEIKVLDDTYGIETNFSGHGYNVAKALSRLGDSVNFLSVLGNDLYYPVMKNVLVNEGIRTEYIVPSLNATPHTIILYADEKDRQVINDLKESREIEYDENAFKKALDECEVAVMCNSNYCKSHLEVVKNSGKKIFSDVHAISTIDDERNKPFMEYSDILCLSHENLKEPYEDIIKEIENRYGNEIILMGMGGKGTMMYVKKDNFIGRFPIVRTRKTVNTLGAGDSQLSAFLHFYDKTGNPYYALKAAILFASYKIGSLSASDGFITEEQVELFYKTIWK